MPVFQVTTRSTNGVTATRAGSARSNYVQKPELRCLVDEPVTTATAKAERAQRPPRVGAIRVSVRRLRHVVPYSAALRIASHSRSAWASRGVTSGYCGSTPDRRRNLPGTGAFASLGAARLDGDGGNIVEPERRSRSFAFDQGGGRGDAQLGEIDVDRDPEKLRIRDIHDRRGFERGADALGRPFELERAGDDAAQIAQLSPAFRQRVIAPGRWHRRKSFKMHGVARRDRARATPLRR